MRRQFDRWRRAVLLVLPLCCAIAAAAADEKPGGPAGLHLPRTHRTSFSHVLTDGGGFRWDLQHFGTVGQGTSFAYGGGLYCRVNNANVSSDGRGWLSESRDEIEIGPWQRRELRVWRRIRVYQDRPLARWLDIIENASDHEVTVPVTIYTCTNRAIQQVVTSSDRPRPGPRDWAFITRSESPESPLLLHLLCARESQIRPEVDIRSNQIHVRWTLTIPAGDTAILCYFESQGRSLEAHRKRMREFRSFEAIRDLPPAVRAMIVNWPPGGGGRVSLDRLDNADTVMVSGDGPKYGRILADSFAIDARFGSVELPAARVVGMAVSGADRQQVRFVLADGQVLSAAVPVGELPLELPTGGLLRIPFARIDQWSFRVSPDRPLSPEFEGPYAVLRDGDRLAFDPSSPELSLRTMHGRVKLRPASLYRLDFVAEGLRLHRATFLHGSHLGGIVEPESLTLRLRLGPEVDMRRADLATLLLAQSHPATDVPTRLLLTNGDELAGRLEGPPLTVATEFGSVEVDPANISSIECDPALRPLMRIHLWDSTQLTGSIGSAPLTIRIEEDTVVRVAPDLLMSMTCREALPPDDMVRRARQLIARLGAESYADRQEASEELEQLGRAIVPILREHLPSARDPEVRRHLEELLERLSPAEEKNDNDPSTAADIRPAVPMRIHVK